MIYIGRDSAVAINLIRYSPITPKANKVIPPKNNMLNMIDVQPSIGTPTNHFFSNKKIMKKALSTAETRPT